MAENMAPAQMFGKSVLKNCRENTKFRLKCLEAQLNIVSHGKSAQDLIRTNGTLKEFIQVFQKSQVKQMTYISISPSLINIFRACIDYPVNKENQNVLKCIISSIVTAMWCLKAPHLKWHLLRHFSLLKSLMKNNTDNIEEFIRIGGKQLLKKYKNNKSTKKIRKIVKRYVNKVSETPQETLTDNHDSTEIIDETQIMEETEEPETGNQSSTPAVDNKQAGFELLDRVIARKKLMATDQKLRKSLESKTEENVEDYKTPVRRIVQLFQKIPWRSE